MSDVDGVFYGIECQTSKWFYALLSIDDTELPI